ncbi:hypothetical protein ACFL6E_05080 [Candidatus Neomarinimicrobiota bacterium]
MNTVDDFTNLYEHGLFFEALIWVENRFEDNTPDYYFYKAYACAKLALNDTPKLPYDISWIDEAWHCLDSFLEMVEDPALEAIGYAFSADLSLHDRYYSSALRNISCALELSPQDGEILAKACQIMDETVSALDGIGKWTNTNLDDVMDIYGLYLIIDADGVRIGDWEPDENDLDEWDEILNKPEIPYILQQDDACNALVIAASEWIRVN